MKADTLGFLAPLGRDITEIDPKIDLDLVHITAAPPWARTMGEVCASIREMRRQIERIQKLEVVTTHEEVETARAII